MLLLLLRGKDGGNRVTPLPLGEPTFHEGSIDGEATADGDAGTRV